MRFVLWILTAIDCPLTRRRNKKQKRALLFYKAIFERMGELNFQVRLPGVVFP